MSTYSTTVIKTGNSYALRVPKKYVEDANLELGQKVQIALPVTQTKQNRQRIQTILGELKEIGAYKDIQDPASWQKELRKERPLPDRE